MRTAQTASIACALAASASADWEVTFLEQTEASFAVGVSGSEQVGFVGNLGQAVPRLWREGGKWENLLPQGYNWGWCIDTDGTQQVGYVKAAGYTAGIWNGTAESFIALGPGMAFDVENGFQVGVSTFGACFWNGTPESRIDLNPPGVQDSIAYAGSNLVQVGNIRTFSFDRHASIWRATAASWAELHPAWATESEALAVHGGQQVGWASTGEGLDELYGSLWTSKASTWRDLNPSFGISAECWGVHEGRQVGTVYPGAGQLACMWRGDAASAENLSVYLPQGFQSDSRAEDIDVDEDGTVRVAGRAGAFAVLWTREYDISPVTAASIFRGTLISGNLASLARSDDDKYGVRVGVVLTSGEAPIQIIIEGTVPVASPNSLDLVVDGRTSAANVQFRVQFFNFQSGQYETTYERQANTEDTYEIAYSTGNHARFVEVGTRKVRARLAFKALGPVLVYPWRCEIDRAIWMTPTQ